MGKAFFCNFINFFHAYMKRLFTIIIFTLTFSVSVFATHQRAGEISYKCLNRLTYEATITTYTYAPSLADRPELELFWGDGTSDIIKRVVQTHLANNINLNIYKYDGASTGGRHTYPAPGTYIMSMEDPNRNSGIINIPNSVNIPFYIETTLVINPFLGNNSSPVLLNPPIDNACIFQPFMHNPWAYDPDGDSLSYHLDKCKGAGGVYIPGYFFPPANNTLTIDPISGELLWDSPQLNGEFNICIIVDEWRKGIWIGSVRRDMQISVVSCTNQPPKILPLKDTCVVAGTKLSFLVTAYDPDSLGITLTGNGSPLLVPSSPAQFTQPATGVATVSSTFTWQTECSHVKKSPYQMNFKVEDNGIPVQLVDFASVNITIVSPAPENLTATPSGNHINLKWNKSICTNGIGYRIYRRNGYYGFFPDHCETGVPAYTGYSLISQNNSINDTTYLDNNNGAGLIRGIDYCYMVISYFSDNAESYASLEACSQLPKDAPVMTNVSVRNTDASSGSMFVAWSKPTEFDTLLIPGPYKYYLFKGAGFNGASYTLVDSLLSINDTTYIDTLLNTTGSPYHYRVDFYNNQPGNVFFVDSAYRASSVYLTLLPSDNKLTLNWKFDVPWLNDTIIIYKLNPLTSVYDSIGFSTTHIYVDTGLINGNNYCYYVKSVGHYSASGFAYPLINLSQRVCGSPTDNEPPCPPVLAGFTNCEMISNTLYWTNPNHFCANDVLSYNLYYSNASGEDYSVIYSSANLQDTLYLHNGIPSIVGCYYVTAVDSFNNESAPSNLVCFDVDQCSLYNLPNIFTPNGDGSNDFFIPFPYNFVEKIDLIIFNRWGTEVFKTEDPDINWDGKNQSSKQNCADGVYYYVCVVYERRLTGLEKRTISGTVQILR
jgi:gliding motility-associated-like protein